MKLIKSLSAIACIISLLAGSALAAEKKEKEATCCEKAKAEGKECTHKCCVAAAKEGKECEKCGGSGEIEKKSEKKDDSKKEEKKN